jgi:hypothetical protein
MELKDWLNSINFTKEDLIIVASPTVISPEHIDAMSKSNPQNRAEFIWALKFF